MTYLAAQLTDNDRERIEETIENAFEFVRDVIEDPFVLDQIPNNSEIVSIPIGSGAIDMREVARTKRFSVCVK